jgi:hypothetical protein
MVQDLTAVCADEQILPLYEIQRFIDKFTKVWSSAGPYPEVFESSLEVQNFLS